MSVVEVSFYACVGLKLKNLPREHSLVALFLKSFYTTSHFSKLVGMFFFKIFQFKKKNF